MNVYLILVHSVYVTTCVVQVCVSYQDRLKLPKTLCTFINQCIFYILYVACCASFRYVKDSYTEPEGQLARTQIEKYVNAPCV